MLTNVRVNRSLILKYTNVYVYLSVRSKYELHGKDIHTNTHDTVCFFF